jgi:hypothetical protein
VPERPGRPVERGVPAWLCSDGQVAVPIGLSRRPRTSSTMPRR